MTIIKHHERYIGMSTQSPVCQWNITHILHILCTGTHACCHGYVKAEGPLTHQSNPLLVYYRITERDFKI
ncbi:hypothetical protein LDENG_00116900 [Lucifuga dentata]|nr:hypothetical protein LDENG_00116900 [Lucifuga dentata]